MISGNCNAAATIPNCVRQSGSTCLTCITDYFILSNRCQPSCSVLCTSCLSPSWGDCSVCQSYASLKNGACYPLYVLNSAVTQEYYSYVYRQDIYSYTDSSSPSTVTCFGTQLQSNGKTIAMTLGQLRSYSVTLIGRAYWLSTAAGTITMTLNG